MVGIGCRLPGGVQGPRDLWRFLNERGDGIRPVPPDRWSNDRYHDADRSKAGVIANDRGGFIEGVDLWDREFFGYFPAEASRIDPQQRLLLEVAHEAFEDAGVLVEELAGSRTSVFVGAFMYDYLCQQTASSPERWTRSIVCSPLWRGGRSSTRSRPSPRSAGSIVRSSCNPP